jgi:hypothetical protein
MQQCNSLTSARVVAYTTLLPATDALCAGRVPSARQPWRMPRKETTYSPLLFLFVFRWASNKRNEQVIDVAVAMARDEELMQFSTANGFFKKPCNGE